MSATKLVPTATLPSFRLGKGYLRSIEYAAIAILLLLLAGTLYLSLGVLNERNRRASELQVQELQLRRQVKEAKLSNDNKSKLSTTKQTALDSLQQFNERYLKDQRSGRLEMIDLINNLIKKNSLGFQGGISFQQIEDSDVVALRDKQTQTRTRKRENDTLDIFPGLRASFGVSGDYNNIRSFLHDIETSKLFLIIERLDLQSQDSSLKGPGGRGFQPAVSNSAPGTLGVQVIVKAYFRKQQLENVAN